jgi:hypothetical protein
MDMSMIRLKIYHDSCQCHSHLFAGAVFYFFIAIFCTLPIWVYSWISFVNTSNGGRIWLPRNRQRTDSRRCSTIWPCCARLGSSAALDRRKEENEIVDSPWTEAVEFLCVWKTAWIVASACLSDAVVVSHRTIRSTVNSTVNQVSSFEEAVVVVRI